MAERLRTEELPSPWKYAVTSDGRVFFINDDTRTTTWVHPVTGVAVASGYESREDLPPGWQEGSTPDGQIYFVNHYDESTTFSNPVTGRTEMDTDTPDAPQMYAPNNQQSAPPNSHYPESPQSPTLSVKPSFKKRTVPKTEAPKVKRREGAVVSKDGWLQKKDSSGLGVWRKRWCVISDFCLFYYKGADEVNQAGTVMLPSYIIKPVEPRDKITKKFAFKCEHSNMRTYYFAAESDDLMHQWIDALNDASQVNLDRGYGNQDEIDWGSSPLRSPKSLRRNEEPPTNGNYPNGSAHPRQHSPNRSGTGPPRQGGWGNYEDIEFGDRPGGETSLKNGLGPDRSLLQQSSRESWEGSQPRSNHDNGSYSSSQEERRSGQNSHLSPPRSPSLHSSSSRDHSYMDDKPKDPNAGYNYVDISEIKERKRQNQLDSQGSYNDDPRPGDPRSAQHQRSSSRHHDDRGSLGSGHSGHRNGRDEMDGGHPYHDPRVEINVSMATDPDQSWGQRSEAQRSSNPRRSESHRSNASQRSISEPSHQRGLAPMEEVPVTRASTERLHSAPRREESSYQQSTPPRGREPPMHDRVPPQHGRMPPQHGRVPSDYARVPQGHVRSPSEYSRSPSEYSRSPSEYSRSPSEYSRGPPQQGRGSRGPPPQQQHGRGPAQHGRAPHEAGMAPHGRIPPPGHGRGQPRQGRAPPHQRQDHVRVPSHHGQGRPRQGQGRGYPPQGGAPHHQERMPIQQSRAPQEHSRVPPNQGRPHSMHGRPPPQHDRTPSRASTMPRDMSPSHSPARGSDRDSIDAAPTRRTYSASLTSLNRNDTLKRQELEKDDEVAPLQPLGARQAAPKTGRYRMWQQKTQQFVDLSTGIRLRLSIAAGDLVGKSHEELVLFLIQLRRDKANLQEWLAMIDNELTLLRDPNSSSANSSRLRPRSNESLRRSPPDLSEDDQEYYQEILTEREDIARELDISAPLINLVDNLVRMGSLYGGDNHMIAQEFYGDKVQKGLPYSPPKKLIEFSRRLEEEKLVQDLEDELRQLETAEDVELQEKLDQLYDLDKTLQEISARVSVLKDEKDKIENTLQRLDQQITHDWDDKEMVAKIEEQQRQLERQLTRVRGQLAQGTKELEEITAENSRIEHEVALMRSGMEGMNDISRQKSADSAKEKLQMEREVNHVQSVMNGLERQRTSLANQMDTLRRTQATGSKGKVVHRKSSREALLSGPYVVTDLDTLKSVDISALRIAPSTPETNNNSTFADTTLDGYSDSKQSFNDPMQSYTDTKQSFSEPNQQYLDTKRSQLDSPMTQAISPGVYPAQKGQYNQGDSILGSGDPFARYNDSYDPASGEYYQGKGVPGEDSLAGRGDQVGYDQREFSQEQDRYDSDMEKYQGRGYDPDLSHRSDFDRSIGDAGGNDANNLTNDSKVLDGQTPYNIPSFDDVNDQLFVSPARVDVNVYSGKSNLEPRVAEQGLVQAEYSNPVYSSPSFSNTPPQGSGSTGKGKGFWSTNLDTKETHAYPEPGELLFGMEEEEVKRSMEKPVMEPLPHPYDMDESFEQKSPEPVQPPPLKSPEANSDLTPVGLFHYTSLSPKSFDDQPTKKQSSKQSLDRAQNALPDYATHDGYTSPPNTMSNSAPQDRSYFADVPAGNAVGDSTKVDGPATLPYTSKQWDEYASQPQWDYGFQDNQAPPSESSYRSDDSKPKERKTSLYGPTPFRKTSAVDPLSKAIPGFSSVSGVTRRRKPGMDEEKKNRRKSASERLLNSGSQPHSEPQRDAFSDTEMEPSPVMAIKPGKSPVSRLKRQTSASQRLIRSARAKSLPGNINLPSSDNGTVQAPPSDYEPVPAPVLSPSTSLPPPSPTRDDVFVTGQKKIHTLDGTIMYKPSSPWEKALANDLPMGELQRALKTKDEELEEEEQRRKSNYVYKSDLKNVEFDESTGGGLLGIPAKVHIPERYNPADEDMNEIETETPEERAQREQKAKKMAKILSSQSMQEWHPREILPEWSGGQPSVDMKQRVEREKELRQEVLVKRRALAHEVSQQTKVLAD